MLGPVVNSIVIVVFGLIGCFLIRGIPPRFEEIIKKALGLSLILMGISGALGNERALLLIVSMVVGAVIGEGIDIDNLTNRFGLWAEKRLGVKNAAKSSRSFSQGFVTASILFCAGSMAIVGSIQSGAEGNHEMLFVKSALDGVMSIVFGASLGIGVVFAAIPVLLYQGGIALAAMAFRGFLTPEIVREMAAVGSLIIAALGFNFLNIKPIKAANLIPAIFVILIFMLAEGLF
jgi:hypothetical protein